MVGPRVATWHSLNCLDTGEYRLPAPSMFSSPSALHTSPSSLTKPEGAQSVLEVASGTGEHTSHFAAAFPGTRFQPTDLTPELFPSIAAHALGLPNVQAPKVLDASQARAPAALGWPCLWRCHCIGALLGKEGCCCSCELVALSQRCCYSHRTAGAAKLLLTCLQCLLVCG